MGVYSGAGTHWTLSHLQDGGILMHLSAGLIPPVAQLVGGSMCQSLNLNIAL